MKKRIVSLFMALVMTLSLLPSAWAAELTAPQEDAASTVEPSAQEVPAAAAEAMPAAEQDAEAELTEENSFLLLASNGVKVIIEPERVAYQPGDTVAQALERTGHAFTGLELEYISAIDGSEGSYNRYNDKGGYDLAQSAAQIKAFMFVTFSFDKKTAEAQATALYRMADQMLAWEKAEAPVQKFARQAYDAAHEALLDGGDFAALADTLQQRMAQYQDFLDAEKYPLSLTFRDSSGEALTEYTFVAENPYGTCETFTQDDTLALAAGDYTFTLTSGYNGAFGAITVDEGGAVTVGGQTVKTFKVPQGLEWIAQPRLLTVTNGDPEKDIYPAEGGQNHTSTALLPDTVSRRGQLYLYAVPGADAADGQWNGGALSLYACYTTVTGKEQAIKRAWLSDSDALTDLVGTGIQGSTLRLEARAATDGYTMYQTWTTELERVPTLCALSVTADGIAQNIGFRSGGNDYTCTVTSDSVELTPAGFGGAYTVTVNGEPLTDGRYVLPLAEGETVASVTVAADNGRANTYTITFTRVPAVAVTVTHDADVTVKIYNAAGAEIGLGEDGTYPLTPGGSYVYIATKAVYYHTTGAFTVRDGLVVEVAAPSTEDHLNSLTLASAVNKAQSDKYLAEEDFQKARHTYEARVDDSNDALYAWAEADDGCTVAAMQQSGGETQIPGKQNRGTKIDGGVTTGAQTQVFTVRVSHWEENVQHYQEYQVTFCKDLTLFDAELAVDGAETAFYQVADGQVTDIPYFDGEKYDYRATIVRAAEEAEFTVTLPYEGNTLRVNDVDYPPDTDPETGKALLTTTVTLPLDSTKDEEAFVLTAHNSESADALPHTYTVTLKKGDPISTTIIVADSKGETIDGALAAVYDGRSNTRVWPDANGDFQLVDGLSYTCVATCAGYVGASEEFTAGARASTITIKLTAAPDSSHGEGVTSRWPSFRGNDDANGVVTDATPISRETAVLSWANKLGSGYDSSAVSCPILITEGDVDYLIVYSGTTLYKVESVTGTVVATGDMYCTSSFAINSATYGEGMLFVALKDGIVQAFDAATLRSLWLYQDPLKGQPNCPITYYDGYLYTGFWNSETKNANYVCLSATDEDPSQTMERKLARWTSASAGGFYWAGAYVCDDYLLVGTDDGDSRYLNYTGAVLCIDPDTGAVLDKLEGLRGDVRCNIAKSGDRFYFTSKGGYFYSVSMNGTSFDRGSLKKIYLDNGGNDESRPPMSTCTPVVYNGRAYIGVSGTSQFGAYSGHNITVIDLATWSIAYTVPTMGYPQTSGLLTTAYDGSVYVYFFDNYTPGKLRLLKDKPGQRSAELITQEVNTVQDDEQVIDAAYALFTPVDDQAQYAICSPISDEYGTLYFKNDSANLMALTNTVTKMAVTKQPAKTTYQAGETFDPAGMEITLTYANGKIRTLPASRTINGKTIPYFTWNAKVTEDDEDFVINFAPLMYSSDETGAAVAVTQTATLRLTVIPIEYPDGDVNGDGVVDVYDVQRLYEHCCGLKELSIPAQERSDFNHDDRADVLDLQMLYTFLISGEWENASSSTQAAAMKTSTAQTEDTQQSQTHRLSVSNVLAAWSRKGSGDQKSGAQARPTAAVLTQTAAVKQLASSSKYPKGDVNGDHTVDVYDLQRLYEHCSESNKLGITAQNRADLNGDGFANILDLQMLYTFLVSGKWETSPSDTHAITVKTTAPQTAETEQGKEYKLRMSDVFTTCGHDVAYTLDGGDHGTHTKLASDADGWFLSFARPETGTDTLTITATCTQDKTVIATHTITITVTEGEAGDERQYGYDETPASSVTVYVTISNDGVPIIGNDKDHTILSHLKVEVPYFDLANYGLEEFYRYGTDGGRGSYVNEDLIRRPTALHLYLYMLGVYCQGYKPEQVKNGEAEIVGAVSNHTVYDDLLENPAPANWGEKLALNITGSATSMYMQQFWGHDENLMYYRNHVYPLMSPGWGSTADYILLSDGDTIDLAMFSNWDFYTKGAFACFDKDEYNLKTGETLTFKAQKYDTQSVSDGGTETMTPISGMTVAVYDANWNTVADVAPTDDTGNAYEYTFPKAGDYYLLAIDPNAATADACYAPATARVHVSAAS